MGGTSSSTARRRNNNSYYNHPLPPPPSHHLTTYPPQPDPYPYPYPSPYYPDPTQNHLIPRQQQPPPSFSPYYSNQYNGWVQIRPAAVAVAPQPVYVEEGQAKKVRNDVNVHKDTLRVEVDEENEDCFLVSFVFDAMVDGSITIYYFAKEEADGNFVPVFSEAFVPVKVPFTKGLGQRFRQPSGTGIDFGFFELGDLSKPSEGEEVFPLVICAETCLPFISTQGGLIDPLPSTRPNMQVTQAVLEKNNEESFKVRVIRQILWVDQVRYELREIYGIGNSTDGYNDHDSGKECVICMTEPKDTVALPCRHMCMCSDCAKELRIQSNKCPICRQPIEELRVIKIDNVGE